LCAALADPAQLGQLAQGFGERLPEAGGLAGGEGLGADAEQGVLAPVDRHLAALGLVAGQLRKLGQLGQRHLQAGPVAVGLQPADEVELTRLKQGQELVRVGTAVVDERHPAGPLEHGGKTALQPLGQLAGGGRVGSVAGVDVVEERQLEAARGEQGEPDLAQVVPLLLEVGITLHHVRRRLPTEVRVAAPDHPLAGRVLRARHVYRRYGRLWLVLVLPDGGVSSVDVLDTDVLEAEPVVRAASGTSTLSSEGARRLIGLLEACMGRIAPGADQGAAGRAR